MQAGPCSPRASIVRMGSMVWGTACSPRAQKQHTISLTLPPYNCTKQHPHSRACACLLLACSPTRPLTSAAPTRPLGSSLGAGRLGGSSLSASAGARRPGPLGAAPAAARAAKPVAVKPEPEPQAYEGEEEYDEPMPMQDDDDGHGETCFHLCIIVMLPYDERHEACAGAAVVSLITYQLLASLFWRPSSSWVLAIGTCMLGCALGPLCFLQLTHSATGTWVVFLPFSGAEPAAIKQDETVMGEEEEEKAAPAPAAATTPAAKTSAAKTPAAQPKAQPLKEEPAAAQQQQAGPATPGPAAPPEEPATAVSGWAQMYEVRCCMHYV